MNIPLLDVIKKKIPKKAKNFLKEKILYPIFREPATFSQAGEDAVLKFLFLDRHLDLSKITYLDIGARHPTCGSNTFLFYTSGSSGVCVEADKESVGLIREARPRDVTLHVAVSDSHEKTGSLFLMEGGGSTLDKQEAEERVGLGKAKINGVDEVPLIYINTLIKENFVTYPVLLSIDIEGMDLPVLQSLDFDTYPIPVICAETCMYSDTHVRPKDESIADFLGTKGYQIYADTYINTIFVHSKWFNT